MALKHKIGHPSSSPETNSHPILRLMLTGGSNSSSQWPFQRCKGSAGANVELDWELESSNDRAQTIIVWAHAGPRDQLRHWEGLLRNLNCECSGSLRFSFDKASFSPSCDRQLRIFLGSLICVCYELELVRWARLGFCNYSKMLHFGIERIKSVPNPP